MAPKKLPPKSRPLGAKPPKVKPATEQTSPSVEITEDPALVASGDAEEEWMNVDNVKTRRRSKKDKPSSREHTNSRPSTMITSITSCTSAETSEDVTDVQVKYSMSIGDGSASKPSPAIVSSLVAPLDTPVASSRESMSTLLKDIERLTNGKEDAPSLRAKIKSSILPIIDGITQIHEHEVRSLKAKIMELEQRQQEAAARSLVVTSFENSLDRVSEGQVKSEVESLNGTIDDFAADLAEKVFDAPADLSALVEARKSGGNAILTTSSYLRIDDDENRGYLIEALVHKHIVDRLHHLFFEDLIAVNNKLSETIEDMYQTVVLKEETWKVAQRWRAITSNVIDCQMKSSTIDTHIAKTADMIAKDMSLAAGRLVSALPCLEEDIRKGLPAIYAEARKVASLARRDHVSSQLRISITPSKQEMPIIDTARVEIQWAGIVAPEDNDRVLGTFSFGLQKLEEAGLPTVLLRPKIITASLERLDPDHTRREAKKAEAKKVAAAKKAARRAAKGEFGEVDEVDEADEAGEMPTEGGGLEEAEQDIVTEHPTATLYKLILSLGGQTVM